MFGSSLSLSLNLFYFYFQVKFNTFKISKKKKTLACLFADEIAINLQDL